jgi:hypothetical protein
MHGPQAEIERELKALSLSVIGIAFLDAASQVAHEGTERSRSSGERVEIEGRLSLVPQIEQRQARIRRGKLTGVDAAGGIKSPAQNRPQTQPFWSTVRCGNGDSVGQGSLYICAGMRTVTVDNCLRVSAGIHIEQLHSRRSSDVELDKRDRVPAGLIPRKRLRRTGIDDNVIAHAAGV